jgi:hypothetical protein
MSHCHLFSHTVSHTWHCYYDEVGFSLFVEGRSVTARYEAVCFGDDTNVDPAAADQPPPRPPVILYRMPHGHLGMGHGDIWANSGGSA